VITVIKILDPLKRILIRIQCIGIHRTDYRYTNSLASEFNMYWSYVGYMRWRSLHIPTNCGFGLVSGLDPVLIGFVDPDPDLKS
jgi:hypothetical protein